MASVASTTETSLYLYGITVADEAAVLPQRGVGGADVEPIAEFEIAAMVSRLGTRKLRPQRSNLAAHHRLLQDMALRQPVAPVVFGTLVTCEESLRDLLRTNRDSLVDLLTRLRGKVEMGLKVYWDLPNVFDYFVGTHQELEAMRNRLFQPHRTPSLEEKLALGQLFETLLRDARQRHTERVMGALAPYCSEVRKIDPGEEQMIMKLACLVQSDRQQRWEEGVRRAAAAFDENYRFDYNGPWPPYNFVDIDLNHS